MEVTVWVQRFFWLKSEDSAAPRFDITLFKRMVENIKQANNNVKEEKIKKLISIDGLITHHQDKKTKRKVLAACKEFDYPHEHHTCKKLASIGFDVILVPHGYFKRHQKKFDVFVLRDHVFLESDLKTITSANPDTIGNRIKEGSEQSSRLVLDIQSDINKMILIDGLRLGCQRNKMIKQIVLFYKSQYYLLDKNKILSKNIYKAL